MEYTNLGSTGLKVSRLGFGGIPIQRRPLPSYTSSRSTASTT